VSVASAFFASRVVVELADGAGAAPLATKLLADLGCPVVKVEPPRGDSLRRDSVRGDADRFALVSATKDSVCIDLAHALATEALDPLLAAADAVVADRDGYARLMALYTDETLRARFPRLTIASCTPFGLRGSLAGWRAGEEGVQAMSGILTTTGHPGHPPARVAGAIVTHATAMYAATSIVADFRAKERSGRGARLDLAMFDAAISLLTSAFPAFFLSGVSPVGLGNRHSMAAPWNTYRCRDGWVVICAGNEPTWQRLIVALGRPDLGTDASYATQEARVRNVDALDAEVERWTQGRTTRDVESALDGQGIPCGSILPLADVLEHPQFVSRGLRVRCGDAQVTGGIFHRDGAPLPLRPARWQRGGATRAWLRERLAVDPACYDGWLRDGVVAETGEAHAAAA
jgi:CoA:oxalate CoA-transferase